MTIKEKNDNTNQTQRNNNNSRRPMRKKCFECNYCSLKFIGQDTLTLHEDVHELYGHEPKYGVACKHCDQNFATKSGLKNHSCTEKSNAQDDSISIENSKLFECHVCQKRFLSQTNLRSHILVHVSEKPMACDQCSMKFVDKKERDAHVNTHWGEKIVRCNFCGKKFGSDRELTRHERVHLWIQSFEQYEIFEVDGSKLIFQSVETDVEQSIAMDVDSDDRDLDGMNCQNESVRDQDVNEVYDEVEGSKMAEKECDGTVDATFAEVFVEEAHEALAKASNIISIKESPDKLSSNGSVDPLDDSPVEMRQKDSTGTIAQPKKGNGYECSQCKNVFNHRGHLNRHKLVHTGKRFKCNYCDKTFSRPDYRIVHERTKHLNIKKSSNTVKSDNGPRQLNSKKFQCFDCKKDFTNKRNLKLHLNKHDRDQDASKTVPTKYECRKCKKNFKKGYNLRRHELVHTEQRFKCNYCDKVYGRPDIRDRHERTKHQNA